MIYKDFEEGYYEKIPRFLHDKEGRLTWRDLNRDKWVIIDLNLGINFAR